METAKEILVWIVGVMLTVWGAILVLGSPLFWGMLMLFLGVYCIVYASKLSEGGK